VGLVLAAGSLLVSRFVYTPTGVKGSSWRGGQIMEALLTPEVLPQKTLVNASPSPEHFQVQLQTPKI